MIPGEVSRNPSELLILVCRTSRLLYYPPFYEVVTS